jgi:quercetin dioxygenase-like cupin family protein
LDIEPRKPQVLRSDDETRVIAVYLPSGAELREHQVHERAYLVVADGEVEISPDDEGATAGDVITGGAGLLCHFAPNERRTVRAKTDARILLVLSPWPGVGHPSRPAEAAAAG